jgi:uncharacterized protein
MTAASASTVNRLRMGSRAEPRNRDVHLFHSEAGAFLFVVNGSQVYGIDEETYQSFERGIALGDQAIKDQLATLWLSGARFVDDAAVIDPPVRSLSLAVAQKCNLGCTYCYAREGDFGGPAKSMPGEIARQSLDRLFAQAKAGDQVNLTFLGGEPLLNRPVIRDATEYAARRGEETNIKVGFSITTNGTLLTEDDGQFFERHGFAVTVSIDGVGATHDRLRSYKSGKASYERIIERVCPLLKVQRRMQISARVTVTPRNLELATTLHELVALGFFSVGFSPMLSSPAGRDEMQTGDLETMLEEMIACGRAFESQVMAGRRFPFANLATALREIHRGTHRPYPCGAGGGYFGVSAEGGLFACHRFVDDESGAMGDVWDGVDLEKQRAWLQHRHVHFQEPCNRCWARYLCGGGCHHEVIHRGRPACDYIRGWLDYCLQAYVRLLRHRPDYFDPAA